MLASSVRTKHAAHVAAVEHAVPWTTQLRWRHRLNRIQAVTNLRPRDRRRWPECRGPASPSPRWCLFQRCRHPSDRSCSSSLGRPSRGGRVRWRSSPIRGRTGRHPPGAQTHGIARARSPNRERSSRPIRGRRSPVPALPGDASRVTALASTHTTWPLSLPLDEVVADYQEGTARRRTQSSKGRKGTTGADRTPRSSRSAAEHRGEEAACARRAALPGRRGPATDDCGLQKLIRRLARGSLDARCSPHVLRHTFARSFLTNGGDVFSLQRILGHSPTSIDVTRLRSTAR
jgi:hypothetical protein